MTLTLEQQSLQFLQDIDNAQDSDDLCSIIYRINGGLLLPQVVFDPRSGLLRSFSVLEHIARESLTQIFKVNTMNQEVAEFLVLNQETFQKQAKKRKQTLPPPLAAEQTRETQRQLFMQDNRSNPELYFEVSGCPYD